MRFYERRLPHWVVVGQALFVTFRLHDSLPSNRVFLPAQLTTGKAFVAMDRILDQAATGPRHLAVPEIAALVVASLHDGERTFHRYKLHAYVVMPNHVHMLVTPSVDASQWLRSLKGFTGHEANRLLGRTGNPFWQGESYDHLVRSRDEFERIQRYIENNPVKAGLVLQPRDFLWSSSREPAESRLPA
jgi:REP element-mobilizing transposase RayT